MNERYDQDMLLGYIEGELSDEQRALFEQRLAEDDRLQRLVEKLRADREALCSLPPAEPPRDLLDDATFQLERQMLLGEPAETASLPVHGRSRQRVNWTQTLTYSGLAAAVLICAGVIFLTLSDNTLLEQTRHFSLHIAQEQFGGSAASDRTEVADTTAAADSAEDGGAGEADHGESDDASVDQFAQREPSEKQADSATASLAHRDNAAAEAPLADADATSPPVQADAAHAKSRDGSRASESNADGTMALALRSRSVPDPSPVRRQLEQAMRADLKLHGPRLAGRERTGNLRSMRVEVATDDPVQAHRDVLAWAKDNDAHVVAAGGGDGAGAAHAAVGSTLAAETKVDVEVGVDADVAASNQPSSNVDDVGTQAIQREMALAGRPQQEQQEQEGQEEQKGQQAPAREQTQAQSLQASPPPEQAAMEVSPASNASGRQRLVLRLRAEQVDAMVAYLNRVEAQRAVVVSDVALAGNAGSVVAEPMSVPSADRASADQPTTQPTTHDVAEPAEPEPASGDEMMALQFQGQRGPADTPHDHADDSAERQGMDASPAASQAPSQPRDTPPETPPDTSPESPAQTPPDTPAATQPALRTDEIQTQANTAVAQSVHEHEKEALEAEVARAFDYLRLLESQLSGMSTDPMPAAYAPADEPGPVMVEVSVVIDKRAVQPDANEVSDEVDEAGDGEQEGAETDRPRDPS